MQPEEPPARVNQQGPPPSYGPYPQPAAYPPRPPRGVTVGIAVQLFGIALAVWSLTIPAGYGGAVTVLGNPTIGGIGVFVVLLGLIMHIGRI